MSTLAESDFPPLPREVEAIIFRYLSLSDIYVSQFVSKRWLTVVWEALHELDVRKFSPGLVNRIAQRELARSPNVYSVKTHTNVDFTHFKKIRKLHITSVTYSKQLLYLTNLEKFSFDTVSAHAEMLEDDFLNGLLRLTNIRELGLGLALYNPMVTMFTNLTAVNLINPGLLFDNPWMSQLTKLKKLVLLFTNEKKNFIPDSAAALRFQPISHLTTLEYLHLERPDINPISWDDLDCLTNLHKLTRLKYNMNNTDIHKRFSYLTQLKHVDICCQCPASSLANFAQVEKITFRGMKLFQEGSPNFLSRFTNLTKLTFLRCNLYNANLNMLSEVTSLKTLKLKKTDVFLATMDRFDTFTQLDEFMLFQCSNLYTSTPISKMTFLRALTTNVPEYKQESISFANFTRLQSLRLEFDREPKLPHRRVQSIRLQAPTAIVERRFDREDWRPTARRNSKTEHRK